MKVTDFHKQWWLSSIPRPEFDDGSLEGFLSSVPTEPRHIRMGEVESVGLTEEQLTDINTQHQQEWDSERLYLETKGKQALATQHNASPFSFEKVTAYQKV